MKNIFKYVIIFFLIGMVSFNFWSEKSLDTSKQIDKILIIKHQRKLLVFSGDEVLKSYQISLGREPVGKKEFEGDKKTPEGVYYINDKNPNSSYHLNLGISYPNKFDIKNAKEMNKKPGGQIKIHGLRNWLGFIGKFHRFFDWTLGCIALTNSEIEELYYNVPLGTKVEIIK